LDCFLHKKSSSKYSCLCQAAKVGSLTTLRQLLADASIDINEQNRFGRTALHYACRGGHTQAIRLLIEEGHARVDILSNTLSSTAHDCCRFGHADALRLLLQVDDELVHLVNSFGSLPIHIACNAGYANCVQVLLEWSSSISARNKKGLTPIHIACENADEEIAHLLLERSTHTQLLIRDAYDSLPLHHACQNNMLSVVETMLAVLEKMGWLPQALELPDCMGCTPLDYAAKNFGAVSFTERELRQEIEKSKLEEAVKPEFRESSLTFISDPQNSSDLVQGTQLHDAVHKAPGTSSNANANLDANKLYIQLQDGTGSRPPTKATDSCILM